MDMFIPSSSIKVVPRPLGMRGLQSLSHHNLPAFFREEFAKNKLDKFVTVTHRDVCSDGFGDHMKGAADAVFLDLPSPWEAIPHAAASLKRGGWLCFFCPCIEQVQSSCEKAAQLGFKG